MKFFKYVLFVISLSSAMELSASVVDIQDKPRSDSSWHTSYNLYNAFNWGESRKEFSLDNMVSGDYVINFDFLNPHIDTTPFPFNWTSSLSLTTDHNDGFISLHEIKSCYNLQCNSYQSIGFEFDKNALVNVVNSVLLSANKISGLFAVHLDSDVKYFLFVNDYDYRFANSSPFTISINSIAPSPVPLPAAVWMFVSAIVGFFCIAHKC